VSSSPCKCTDCEEGKRSHPCKGLVKTRKGRRSGQGWPIGAEQRNELHECICQLRLPRVNKKDTRDEVPTKSASSKEPPYRLSNDVGKILFEGQVFILTSYHAKLLEVSSFFCYEN